MPAENLPTEAIENQIEENKQAVDFAEKIGSLTAKIEALEKSLSEAMEKIQQAENNASEAAITAAVAIDEVAALAQVEEKEAEETEIEKSEEIEAEPEPEPEPENSDIPEVEIIADEQPEVMEQIKHKNRYFI